MAVGDGYPSHVLVPPPIAICWLLAFSVNRFSISFLICEQFPAYVCLMHPTFAVGLWKKDSDCVSGSFACQLHVLVIVGVDPSHQPRLMKFCTGKPDLVIFLKETNPRICNFKVWSGFWKILSERILIQAENVKVSPWSFAKDPPKRSYMKDSGPCGIGIMTSTY